MVTPTVVNNTGVRQVWSGLELPVGQKVEVPQDLAFALHGRPGYQVDLKGRGKWRERDGTYLYFLAPFSVLDGYGSQAEDLALTWEAMSNIKLTARHHWLLNPFGLRPETLAILNRPVQYPHLVGLCYATPGAFWRLPTLYRVGLTMYESSDPREMYPQWTHQINDIDLLLAPSEWCKNMWRQASVYTPIKVVELSASHHFLEAPLWERPKRNPREFVVVAWAMMTPRKSPLETISVFKKAFPAPHYPKCRLRIKTRRHLCGSIEHDFPKVNDDRIEIIDEDWTYPQMVEFARNADVAILLPKGEGSGRPAREAIALGLPTIVADNTGHTSICKPEYMTVIPTHHTEPSPLGGKWCIPDWDMAIDALRWHYRNRDEASDRARRGARWYRREHSLQNICQGILEAMKDVTDRPSKQAEKESNTWSGFYEPEKVELKTVKHIQDHHKRFFQYMSEKYPPRSNLLEIGIGTGAFYAKLHQSGFRVSALDNDHRVIDTAKSVLRRLRIRPCIGVGDTFSLNGHNADVIYHQGLLEHFENEDICHIIEQQLKAARHVVFSVPSVYYPTRDFGNERLMRLEEWRTILKDYRLEHSEYYGGDGRFHVLVDISGESPIRGYGMRRL